MKQVVIFLLFLAPVRTCNSRCYDENMLSKEATWKLRKVYKQPEEPQVSGSPAGCPRDLYRRLEALEDRSLSPWRYIRVPKDDHFPSTYVRAECLCSGCILVRNNRVEETHDYNSATVDQTRVFLKKEPCNGTNRYRLTPVYEKVAVGCTCVRAKVSS